MLFPRIRITYRFFSRKMTIYKITYPCFLELIKVIFLFVDCFFIYISDSPTMPSNTFPGSREVPFPQVSRTTNK